MLDENKIIYENELSTKKLIEYVRLWILYDCEYIKEGGVLSDFEKVFGYKSQNKTAIKFLKELIDEGCLIQKGFRLRNEISYQIYVIDRKKIFTKIKTYEKLFNTTKKVMDREYTIIEA